MAVLRLRGDPFIGDTEQILSWIDGHCHVETLSAIEGTSGLVAP